MDELAELAKLASRASAIDVAQAIVEAERDHFVIPRIGLSGLEPGVFVGRSAGRARRRGCGT